MPTIAGASQFLNNATLANARGFAAQAPNVLAEASTFSLLEAGRDALSIRGFGISKSARALNQQFLNNTSLVNEMFSLGVGADATVDGARQQILALRSRLPQSSLAPSLRGTSLDEEA